MLLPLLFLAGVTAVTSVPAGGTRAGDCVDGCNVNRYRFEVFFLPTDVSWCMLQHSLCQYSFVPSASPVLPATKENINISKIQHLRKFT